MVLLLQITNHNIKMSIQRHQVSTPARLRNNWRRAADALIQGAEYAFRNRDAIMRSDRDWETTAP